MASRGLAAKWRTIAFAFGLACSCSDSDPERVALFTIVTDGSIQRDHPCNNVRDRELSSRNGFLPAAAVDALKNAIEKAELDEVRHCLATVQAYNQCFRDLPCNAFAAGTLPAWLLGAESAPCACGVVGTDKTPGPFASRGVLPDTLAACDGLLPVTVGPPQPGASCP